MNQNVFDEELYDIGEVPSIALGDGKTGQGSVSQSENTLWTKMHMWADIYTVVK